jgi:BirA family biotin operon repressor/biotin-[acetyl-CoA-carboxylase] ligase
VTGREAATFDRARFESRLRTRHLGRMLIVRAAAESTNDVAWEALATGAPPGVAVVADAQTRGRGRDGRSWETTPGAGLALSVALDVGCDRPASGAFGLVAGLALARALDELGLGADLKWPNDLLCGGRKLSGILCESRRAATGEDLVVVGVGVNVTQRRDDFPPELGDLATSLALEGLVTDRESVASGFLNQLEPLDQALEEAGLDVVLEAWRARAGFWGQPVQARTASGEVRGIARGLDPSGGLVLALPDGREVTVLSGDLELERSDAGARPTGGPS